VNRQAQAVVMLLLGGAVLRTSIGDLYLRYVKAGLRPFLIAAGALLIIAALMTLWHEFRSSHGDEHGRDDGHDHGDGKPHREPRIGWMIIAPVLGLLLVAPPAMGAFAAGQSGTALSTAAESDFPPLPSGDDVLPITMLDYASRAVFDKGQSLGDRRVRLTGFLATGSDGRQVLARMILSCCAADARPIKVGFAGSGPAGLADDSWVEVEGVYSDQRVTDAVNGEIIPFIAVSSWRSIPPPKEQYE